MPKNFFKGKKITVVGINPEGRGVLDAEYLAFCGAFVTVTDIQTEKELKSSVDKLKKYKNIKFSLGGHKISDFKNKDLIIRPANIKEDIYFKEAKKNNIDIKTDESLFLALCPNITFIGITGTRGKSTTTHLVYEVIKNAKKRVFIAGNVRGEAALPLLKKVKKDDIVVMELDSWKLQGLEKEKMSPDIAVFTSFYPDHLNYYKGNIKNYFNDKSTIFKYQNDKNILILGDSAKKAIKKYYKKKIKSKILYADKNDIPKSWNLKIKGKHNKENIALALEVLKQLKLKRKDIKEGIEKFKGVSGRMELLGKKNNIYFYNDTTATSPDATMVALKTLGKKKNIILLAGGSDKKLEYKDFAKEVKKYTKGVVLFSGDATEKIKKEFKNINFNKILAEVSDMKKAVKIAEDFSKKGDIILLSPGAASFGVFKNEFDRGDQFNKQYNFSNKK